MNLNIFKRVYELEGEVAGLQNEIAGLRNILFEYTEMIRHHIVKSEAEIRTIMTKAEQIAKREAYKKEYYQRTRAKETPEQAAKRKAYAKAYYQRAKAKREA
jgi:regulator of replication initiation timing